MKLKDETERATLADKALARRTLLEHIAKAGLVAVLWPDLANATTEVWEEGDPACSVADPLLDKPNGYELDRAYLESFLEVSERLTGVAPLDRHLAREYMERYALNRQLTTNLDLMVRAYRAIPGNPPHNEGEVRQKIMLSADGKVRAAAQQLIFLWYIGAFFIPLPSQSPGPLPPLEDDPNDVRKRIWVYGTPEQYSRALVWSIARAHAPMTSGGRPGHWASAPPALT